MWGLDKDNRKVRQYELLYMSQTGVQGLNTLSRIAIPPVILGSSSHF